MPVALAEAIETTVFEAELEAAAAPPKPHLRLVDAPAPYNSTMHKGVFQAFALVNAAILGVFWITFSGDAGAAFMVAISAVYLAAYLATPYALSRIRHFDQPTDESFSGFLDKPFATWTGAIKGCEALLQILLIPGAILITVTGIAIIIQLVR
ncbi:MAG: hypothetical protein AAGA09_02085 [Pseudomonadota bacterium]